MSKKIPASRKYKKDMNFSFLIRLNGIGKTKEEAWKDIEESIYGPDGLGTIPEDESDIRVEDAETGEEVI